MKKNNKKRLVKVRMGNEGRYIEEADTLEQFKINILKAFKIDSNKDDYTLSCEDKTERITKIEDEISYQKIKNLIINYPKLFLPSLIPREKKIIHKDSKCSVCQISPIEGIRYLCMNCDLFELCSECEQKYGEKHGHPLLKLRKEDYLEIYNNEIFNNNKQTVLKEEN